MYLPLIREKVGFRSCLSCFVELVWAHSWFCNVHYRWASWTESSLKQSSSLYHLFYTRIDIVFPNKFVEFSCCISFTQVPLLFPFFLFWNYFPSIVLLLLSVPYQMRLFVNIKSNLSVCVLVIYLFSCLSSFFLSLYRRSCLRMISVYVWLVAIVLTQWMTVLRCWCFLGVPSEISE